MTTIFVTHMKLGNRQSGPGVTFASPDVCKTPEPTGPFPTPYPMGDVTVITSEPGRSTKVYKVRKGKAVTTATRRDLDDAQTLVVDDAGLVRGHRERCASSTAARDLVRREYGPDAHAVVVSLGEDGKSARSFLVEPRSFSAISVDVNPPVLLAAMRRPA